MIKILVRLDFFYDGEDTIDQFILMVKSGTSFDDVEEELLKAHKYLCEEDETDLYGNLSGRRTGSTAKEKGTEKREERW